MSDSPAWRPGNSRRSPQRIWLWRPLESDFRNSTGIPLWSEWRVKSLSRIRLFATPWTAAHQAPPSTGFSKQENWSGLPFPSPEDFPDPGIEPMSPAFQTDALTSEPPGKLIPHLEAQKRSGKHQDPGEKQWPHRSLDQTYLLVLEGLLWQWGLAVAHCRDKDTGSSSSGEYSLAWGLLEAATKTWPLPTRLLCIDSCVGCLASTQATNRVGTQP